MTTYIMLIFLGDLSMMAGFFILNDLIIVAFMAAVGVLLLV